MSKFLDSLGLTTLWNIIKSTFASSLSFSNRTLTLKNKNGDTLSTVELPYRGIYFVKGTQTVATGTWKGNLPEVDSLYDGLTIAYFLPYNGSGNATLTLTLGSGTTAAEPVYYNNETRASTNYGKGSTVVLTWVSNATTGYEAVGSATGRWTRCDYNSNTVPSAYCTTAASTAAKAATCTNYNLLNNSYIHVLISQTNTAKSALTLNINSKGAKPIYINGTASSSTNYSLPTGTYIVFYNGTNYYFNTNGELPGYINGSSITGTVPVNHGGTGQTTAKDASNAFINALDTETTALQDGDYFIAQTAGGGTTTTTYKRKALSTLSDYIEDKIDDTYLPLAGGTMTGNISWASSSALSRNSDPLYLLSIDAFGSGGATHYSNMSDVATALKDYVVATTNAVMDIPSGSDLDTYKTTGIFRAKTNTIATNLVNCPTDFAFAMLVLPTTSNGCIQFIVQYNPDIYRIWQRSMYNDTWGTWQHYDNGVLHNPYASRPTNIDYTGGENGRGSMFHFVATDATTTGKPFGNANVLQMNWDSGNYDSQLAVGNYGKFLGFRGQNNGSWNGWNYASTINYAECTDASDVETKSVTLSGNVSGITGTEITVKFVNGNTNTKLKLTVNLSPSGTLGTGKAVYYRGTFVDQTYIKPNDIVRMVYDGTRWNIVGSINSVTSYGNHIRYYINRESGSDTNDGLTTNTPFKTIEKFLEVTANAGYTDCRCTILKDGAYVLNKQALNNVTLHIKVDDSVNGNVILQGNYNVPEDWIMYNAHVKLTGTANAPIVYQPYSTQGIYFENSAVTLDYVKFKCRMQGFGCYIKADNIEANTLHFSGCTGYLATVAITNNSHTKHGILLDRGCNMRVSGTFTIGALTDGVASSDSNKNKNYFLNIQDSDIVLQSSYPTTLYNFNNNSTIDITNDSNRTTYSYAYGMRLSNAEITGTRIRLASYVSRGVNKTMLADEESDINVTWGGGSGDSANGRAGFNSLYGLESIVLNTDATDLVSANAIKTWTIPKATIASAVASDHPNVGTSAYPYKILAVVPVSTSDNRVIIKNSTVDSTTGDITVVGRNVTSSKLQNLGIFATVSILYTMSPFSITYHS